MPAYLRALSGLTPYGLGMEPLSAALAHKTACPLRKAPPDIHLGPSPAAGWIHGLPRPERWLGKAARLGRLDRLSQLALITAHRAVELAGGLPEELHAGVALGTAHGCHLTNDQFFGGLLREGEKGASPTLFAYTLPSSATGEIAIHLRLKGPTLTLCQGRGSALAAVGTAARWIEQGRTPWMLAGGVDTLAPALLRERIPGAGPLAEGAAFLVLTADPEGATARIMGHGMAFGPGALQRATEAALERSGTGRERIKTWLGPGASKQWRRTCGNTMSAEGLLQLGVALAEGRSLPAMVTIEASGGGAEALCVGMP